MYCMIDLETLGNTSQAAIVQIGAVIFDENNVLGMHRWTIDIEDALKYGEVTGSTLKWWFSQDVRAIKSAMTGGEKAIDVFNELEELISVYDDLQFYAHATFDFPILDNWCKQLGKPALIPFWLTRDLRTLESFAGHAIEWALREGVHHDALEDALYQAEHAIKMMKMLHKPVKQIGVKNENRN